MNPDQNGFFYPLIDPNKCVDCGSCSASCSFGRPLQPSRKQSVYAAKLEDVEERMKSQSGGVFFALAKKILSEGGVVYGAGMADDLTVRHMRAETLAELETLRMSKYVQSDMNGIFTKIGEDLQLNKQVLFSGTPCQIDAFNSFTKNKNIDTSNYYSIDLICFGVASPKLYDDYLNYTQQRYSKIPLEKFIFRDKLSNGWHGCVEKIIFSKTGENIYYSTIYANIFFSLVGHRASCFSCPYAKTERCSDITIGDFWGIEEAIPDFWDETGVSAIIINTSKGEVLFHDLSGLLVRESNIADCSKKQKCLTGGFDAPRDYDAFWRDYHRYGFEYVSRKYGKNDWRHKVLRKLKYAIKKTLILFFPAQLIYKIKHGIKKLRRQG
jgi:coenzyme F420-reducing hydrogenase beta subunit